MQFITAGYLLEKHLLFQEHFAVKNCFVHYCYG